MQTQNQARSDSPRRRPTSFIWSCTTAIAAFALATGCLADSDEEPHADPDVAAAAGPARSLPLPTAPGEPQVLSAVTVTDDGELPSVMATDAANVYWLSAQGTLSRIFKDGGAIQLLADDPREPIALVVDDEFAYWAVRDYQGDSALLRVPKAGGSVQVLASAEIVHLAVDDERLYWVEDRGAEGLDVISASKDGADLSRLVTLPKTDWGATAFATGSTAIYWLRSTLEQGAPMARLFRMAKTGGVVAMLTSTDEYWSSNRVALSVDEASIAWIDGRQRLLRVAVGGGAITEVDPEGVFKVFGVAAGAVLAVPRDQDEIVRYTSDGVAQLLYTTASTPAMLVADGDSLHWAEWTTICTEERFDGKSAWCAAYQYDVQLVRAAR